VAQSLRDRTRSGRRKSKRQAMQDMVGRVMDTRPSQYGYQAEGWTAALLRYHQEHLRHLRSQWRGWNIVLFLDRGSPHTAKRSRKLARELGIELRWLPVACPELNPVESIWRHLKGTALANRPTLWMEELMQRASGYIQSFSPLGG
jgi:DDE superfamily endonuclease